MSCSCAQLLAHSATVSSDSVDPTSDMLNTLHAIVNSHATLTSPIPFPSGTPATPPATPPLSPPAQTFTNWVIVAAEDDDPPPPVSQPSSAASSGPKKRRSHVLVPKKVVEEVKEPEVSSTGQRD